jgi:hypothetical protein
MATDVGELLTGHTSSSFQRHEKAAAAAFSGGSNWKLLPPGARLVTP